MSSPLFTINEIFVCLHEKDGSKYPYSAKVMAIKKIGSTQFYLIHYRGFKATTDIRIRVGEEAGRMFKGTLEEYGKKFHVAISPDAWEAERKCKRKAGDDSERSLGKKETVVEENVYRKVYAVKRRKLREDSEEATSSDVSKRSRSKREDSEAGTSEVKDSRISKDQENAKKNFKQQNSSNRIHKIPKVIPSDQNEIPEGQETSKKIAMDQSKEFLHKGKEIQDRKAANPEGQIQETQIRINQAKGETPNVLEEIQNLLESPEKSGPIDKKVPDSEVAEKIQNLEDLKVEVPVFEEAVPKKRNNPGYYIPKNDPIYDERIAVLRARYAGILDEVKMSDGLAKILVDDHQLVNLGKKVPRIPVEWTVVKILEEYKKANDTDSYNLLKNIIPRYFDENFRSLLYKIEIPKYEKRVNDEFIRQNLVFKASEHYGLVHLLRLITRIHQFVMMDNSVHNLEHTRTILMDFMTFLDTNKDIFYKKEHDYMNS